MSTYKISLYNMIEVHCDHCGKWMGEIEYGSKVIETRCESCENLTESSILSPSLNTTALMLYKKEMGVNS